MRKKEQNLNWPHGDFVENLPYFEMWKIGVVKVESIGELKLTAPPCAKN
jgi:hypothetical protein